MFTNLSIWWNTLWLTWHSEDMGELLVSASKASSEKKLRHLRMAIGHWKKAERHRPLARLTVEEHCAFEHRKKHLHQQWQKFLLAYMPADERVFCESVLDWWDKSPLWGDPHPLWLIYSEFAGRREQIRGDMRHYCFEVARGSYGTVPDPLAKILLRYLGGASREETIQELDNAVAIITKKMPQLLNPEL